MEEEEHTYKETVKWYLLYYIIRVNVSINEYL